LLDFPKKKKMEKKDSLLSFWGWVIFTAICWGAMYVTAILYGNLALPIFLFALPWIVLFIPRPLWLKRFIFESPVAPFLKNASNVIVAIFILLFIFGLILNMCDQREHPDDPRYEWQGR
jgi:hypothetical protein